jgi:hypothetical protein
MKGNRVRLALLAVLAGLAAWWAATRLAPPEPPGPAPKPPICPGPGPCPAPEPNPPPKPRPWGPRFAPPVGGLDQTAGATIGGRVHNDGTELQCDLPGDFHLKNCGGSDGSGLCVFTSISHSARWQNVAVLEGFRDWMRKHPGGGYPQKVDRMIAEICNEKGVPPPSYLQVEGDDLEVLKTACRSGRMPGVTYSYSPTGRYGGQRISHMVSLVHADDRHFVILDNNFPGRAGQENTYEWMTPAEFKKTYTGGRSGWAVILLDPGPPLPPHNPREE